MPAYLNSTAVGRTEIAGVIQQGTGFNQGLIWNQLLPLYGVNNRTARILKATIAGTQAHRILTDKYLRQPGAHFERATMSFDGETFTIAQRGIEMAIPDEVEMELSEYFSVEILAAMRGADTIDLTNEYLTASALQSTATFGSATAALVDYTIDNKATVNFPQDTLLAIERGRNKGEQYNTIVIPELVFNVIAQSTLTKEWVQSNSGISPVAGASVTPEALQKSFAAWGIEKVLIGRARYSVAADGAATPSYTKCWSTTYITYCRTAPSFLQAENSIQTVTGLGATVYWEKLTPDGVLGVETYRQENVKSNIVRTLTTAQPYIANANCGDLLATSYA